MQRCAANPPRVFFYQLPEEDYDNAQKRYADRTTGPDAVSYTHLTLPTILLV